MAEGLVSLEKYVNQARNANTHPAKLMVLSKLLEEVFNVRLEELLPGVERKTGSKILGVRGSIDLLYSNIIFEIKVDLERELDSAKEELKKYFQAMLEARPNEKFIGIVTDVINYKAFLPVIEEDVVKDIKEISSINISEAPVDEAVLWLDSYIFSKPRIRPTANDLRFRFGPRSPTYAVAVDALRSLWDLVKDEEDAKLKYELWSESMEIVYGSKPRIDAFIDQTYLVTLVKLVVYLRLSGDNTIAKNKVLRALTGEYFAAYGITNLVEEDFFTWIAHPKILDDSVELVSRIAGELLRYDLTQIDEDFFKEIYQEIVERGQRHRVGEYYTPEWLTELVLKEVMSLWRERHPDPPRILDPACGSGTFLCNAIRMLREELAQRGWKQFEILDFILTNVVGVDVNPLAVTIARANYVIALGELLHARAGSIFLPVYVADSIKLSKSTRTLAYDVEVYDYVVNNAHLQIPAEVAKNRNKLSRVIGAFKEATESYRARKDKDEALKVFERALYDVITKPEFEIAKETLESIFTLMDRGRDSIWIYMLSNIYMPIALSESKFDMVVGNPPWIAMRYVENKEYQDFLKNQVFEYGLLDKDQVHLFTQMETATLFYCRCSDLYLRDGGIMAFVMPRSVLTGALHHANFKQFKRPKMKLIKILDLESVSPVFNVPSCVLISVKGDSTSYPVPVRRYQGKLPENNVKLTEASKHLLASDYVYEPPQIPAGRSYYYELFKAGAAIYPRCFFFIDFIIHPTLGIDLKNPLVKTSEEVMKDAKEPWKSVRLEGNIEAEFIYATLLGGDVIPFGYIKLRPVVLPIEPHSVNYYLLNVEALRNRGFPGMANWLTKAQDLWEKYRTGKSKERFPTVLDRLDYNRLLSSQSPMKSFLVLYNTTGKNISSCVIDKRSLPNIALTDKISISPKGFIAETMTMFYETNDELEAHYLCAMLNSDVVNEAIKPLQTKGLYGERHIIRRPLMLPIPKFNPNNSAHKRLAELSKICHAKVAEAELKAKKAGNRRKEARKAIEKELEEINRLVAQLLNLG